MINRRLRRALLACGALVALGSVTALALAARRIAAEEAAYQAPPAGRCVPATLNAAAVLPGTSLSVSPLPGTYAASARTQISLLGVPAAQLSPLSVDGSLTGSHSGRLRPYSQGDGASFVPDVPFAPGEVVRVRGRLRAASRVAPFSFSFAVATQNPLPYLPRQIPPARAGEVQHFRSRHDLVAPAIVVDASAANAHYSAEARSASSAGARLVFATPYEGPGPAGPLIFDQAGNVVWFSPLPRGVVAANLQVQQFDGQPVLTYWRGRVPPQGFGQGEDVILNSSYREVGRVRAGNGYKADLHDFRLGPNQTAVFTVFDPIQCDLSAVGGPHGAAVTDGVFQEVDLRTGLVRREWHGVDHVPLAASVETAVGSTTAWPFDFFHINSVAQQADGRTLISARNTSAVYELNTTSGQVLETIGGRNSSIQLPASARTAFQHDARVLPDGAISIFDNGGSPKVHEQSRGIIMKIDRRAGTAAVVAQYQHSSPLLSASQGNLQLLRGGDAFIGWGSEPYFSEFDASGNTVFDARFRGPYQSYRGYTFSWTGAPVAPPSVAAVHSVATGATRAYASWNGDTRTARWRLLTGSSPRALTPVRTVARAGFETPIAMSGRPAFLAVQALDASGAVLGRSRTVRG